MFTPSTWRPMGPDDPAFKREGTGYEDPEHRLYREGMIWTLVKTSAYLVSARPTWNHNNVTVIAVDAIRRPPRRQLRSPHGDFFYVFRRDVEPFAEGLIHGHDRFRLRDAAHKFSLAYESTSNV